MTRRWWDGRIFRPAPSFVCRIVRAVAVVALILAFGTWIAKGETINEMRAAHGLASLRVDGAVTGRTCC